MDLLISFGIGVIVGGGIAVTAMVAFAHYVINAADADEDLGRGKELADKLELHQRWRRGELEDMPLRPSELGRVIDEIIQRLRGMGQKGNRI